MKHPINYPEHLSNRKSKHWHHPQPTSQTLLMFFEVNLTKKKTY